MFFNYQNKRIKYIFLIVILIFIIIVLRVFYIQVYKHASKKTSIERVHPIGRDLSYEVAEKINDLGYDGVYLLKEIKRYYPYDKVLSHVIGYVGIDNVLRLFLLSSRF